MATWVPVLIMLFMLVTLIGDPWLFGSLVWDLCSWPTKMVRSRYEHPAAGASQSPRLVYVPLSGPQPSVSMNTSFDGVYPPAPASSIPVFVPEVGPPAGPVAPEWFVRCFAGQVGAGIYWLVSRGGARPPTVPP